MMSTMTEGLRLAAQTAVVAKARWRQFTAAGKLRVLREADRCTKPGELSRLLRREGLYSSHLSVWRAARNRWELAGLTPRPRGPQAKPVDPRASAGGAPRGAIRGPGAGGSLRGVARDEHRYLYSERTLYRVLGANAEVRERRDQLRHPHYAAR